MPEGVFLFLFVLFVVAAGVARGRGERKPSRPAIVAFSLLLAVFFAGVLAWQLVKPPPPIEPPVAQLAAVPTMAPAPPKPTPTPTPTPEIEDDGSTVSLWMASVGAPLPGGHSYQFRIALEPALDKANPRSDHNLEGQSVSLLRYPVLPEDKSPSMASGGKFLLFFTEGRLGQPALFLAPWRGGDWGTDTFKPANGAARKNAAVWDANPRLGALTGKVVTASGAPAPRALVQVHEGQAPWRLVRTVACENDGAFRVPHVPVGRVSVRARAPGFAENSNTRGRVWHGDPPAFQRIVLPPGGKISGHVVTTRGVPVGGAVVRSTRTNSPTRTTSEGFFMLDYLPAGMHDLVARARGFAPGLAPDIEVVVRETTEHVHIILHPGMELSGVVVRASDGEDQPVEGADVVASYEIRAPADDGERTRRIESHAASEPDGAFRFEALPSGARVRMEARKGYARARHDGEIAMDPNAPPAPVTLRLPELADVPGRVVSPSGEPVEGAWVRPDSGRRAAPESNDRFLREVETAADGTFLIEGLPAQARYTIEARADGYQPGSAENVVPRDLLENVEVRLGMGGAITGHVLRQETEEPLAHVALRLEGRSGAATRSDSDGVFLFDNVARGRYTIAGSDSPPTVSEEEESPLVVVPVHNIGVEPGQTREDVKVYAAPGRTIAGRVVIAGAEDPVPEATVSLAMARRGRSGRTVTTDAEGRFEISGVPAVRCTVEARKEGMVGVEGWRKSLERDDVEAWENVVLELAPQGNGVIAGSVVDATKAPVEGARLYLATRTSGRSRAQYQRGAVTRSSGADGAFRFDGLMLDQEYQIFASLRTGGMRENKNSPRIRLTEDSPATTITIQLGSGGAIFGRVVDDTGLPVEGAEVAASAGATNPQTRFQGRRGRRFLTPTGATVQTDAEGIYRIEGLGARETEYTAQATKDGYLPSEPVHASGAADSTEVKMPDIVLREGVGLKGILVDLQGNGLGGWQVASSGGPNATTSYSGAFELDGIPEKIGLTVSYRSRSGSLAFQSEKDIEITAEERILILPVGSGVRGRIVADDTGEPLSGVRVTIEQQAEDATVSTGDPPMRLQSARLYMRSTDDDGAFDVEHVPIGTAKLTISGGDLAPFPYRVEVKTGWTELGDIAVPRAVTLTGRLVDAETGAPYRAEGRLGLRAEVFVPGERVRVSVSDPDEQSRIRITGVPAAARSITLSSRRFVDIPIPDLPKLESGKTADLGDIPVSSGAVLTGRIVDADTRKAVAIGTVPGRLQIWGNTASGSSQRLRHSDLGRGAEQGDDAVGRFRITRAPADLVEIYFQAGSNTFHRISKPDYEPYGETDLGDIPLPQGRKLIGRLVGPDGQPPAPIRGSDRQFYLWGQREDSPLVFSARVNFDEEGRFSIGNVPSEMDQVRFFLIGYLPAQVGLAAFNDEGEADLGTIALQKGKAFQATVTENDRPVEGVLILAQTQAPEMPHSIIPELQRVRALRVLPANAYLQLAILDSQPQSDQGLEAGQTRTAGLYPGPVQVFYFSENGLSDPLYTPPSITLNLESYENLRLEIQDGALVQKQ